MSDEQLEAVAKKAPLEGLRRFAFSLLMLPFVGWLVSYDHLTSSDAAQVLMALIGGVFVADLGDKYTKRKMLSSAPKPAPKPRIWSKRDASLDNDEGA
tara:strand:+ start:1666 stop:1959 length:294 start_codon:yes stop_codon:yes gene_type:complete